MRLRAIAICCTALAMLALAPMGQAADYSDPLFDAHLHYKK